MNFHVESQMADIRHLCRELDENALNYIESCMAVAVQRSLIDQSRATTATLQAMRVLGRLRNV